MCASGPARHFGGAVGFLLRAGRIPMEDARSTPAQRQYSGREPKLSIWCWRPADEIEHRVRLMEHRQEQNLDLWTGKPLDSIDAQCALEVPNA